MKNRSVEWLVMECDLLAEADEKECLTFLCMRNQKMMEPEEMLTVPVKGTRHPSSRAERMIATKKRKKKDAALASDRDIRKAEKRSSEKKRPVLPWGKDKWLHPAKVAYSGRLDGGNRRTKEKKALRNWRAEYEDTPVLLRATAYQWRYWEDDSSFIYYLQVWEEDEELWNQAWSERAEEEYWERVDAEEWEEMSTSEEIFNFFD